jgi:hypothetical protein
MNPQAEIAPTALMFRTAWASPLCGFADNGVHVYFVGTHGIMCRNCAAFVQWADCPSYRNWSMYILSSFYNTTRLN